MDHHWVSDGSGRRHRITVIMESRRNGPQLSSRHDDDDDVYCRRQRVALQFKAVKRYSSRRFLKRLQKNYTCRGLDYLLSNIDEYGTAERVPCSGQPHTVWGYVWQHDLKVDTINVKQVNIFNDFCGLNNFLSRRMRYPVWIYCGKQPNYDFWISQGSVATGGQNYSHLRQFFFLMLRAKNY